jgi:N-methylhydantoinase A
LIRVPGDRIFSREPVLFLTMPTSHRIGIDTGGTFTDLIWLDEQSRLRLHKEPSTPFDPSQAINEGLRISTTPPVGTIIHGSTVATNALLERRGVRTALITTAGFTDVLAIGRQNRPDLYALVPHKPPALVPGDRRFGLNERINANGEIVKPIDPDELARLLDMLAGENVESIAVCLLFSFLHPQHERQIAAAINHRFQSALNPPHVSLSSDILPEYREFERTAATVINAYVAPLMSRYLSKLADSLAPRHLTIMQSNGGVISVETASRQAVRTVLSGPAGGVVGARYIAATAGYEDGGFDQIITFDMGGTSTDVALCPGREPVTTDGEISGLPLRVPIIDIHTVGAGGGSLGHVDAGGGLHAGPQSAGAKPGPACYRSDFDAWRHEMDRHFAPGQATVSDANLVLGRLDVEHFLGGQMTLHLEPAVRALTTLAEQINAPSPAAAAWAVIRVANANMERAIRRISVERGHDPRRFTLVAFGGGGPLHACELAEQLQIPRVLIPTVPGVLSALGMLAAAPTRDYSQTVMLPTSDQLTPERLDSLFDAIRDQAIIEMTAEDFSLSDLLLQYGLDMRYVGQSHELTVNYKPGQSRDELTTAFHQAHDGRYGYARLEAESEIVTIRLTAIAPIEPLILDREPAGNTNADAALIGLKPVWFGTGFSPTKLYHREQLQAGNAFSGPAVVFQYDTTTIVPPGWQVLVDEQRNLLLARSSP